MDKQAHTVIVTKAQVKPGRLDQVAKLFAETNPALIKDEPDWLQAVFTADAATNEVTVLAFWANADSYAAFSSGSAFRSTMGRFAEHLAGPPVVNVKRILVGMTRETLWSFDVSQVEQPPNKSNKHE
jgi:heme-degrading monooxygenase HmoA